MPYFQIVRVFEVTRVFEVEAPSESQALANTDDWEETEEITGDVISTEINEVASEDEA